MTHDEGALEALHSSVYAPTGQQARVGRDHPQAARMLDALDHAGWQLVRKPDEGHDKVTHELPNGDVIEWPSTRKDPEVEAAFAPVREANAREARETYQRLTLPVIERTGAYPVLSDTHNMLGWPLVGKCTTCGGPACMLFSTRDIAEYECRPNWPVDAAPGKHPNNVFKVYDL